jgi:Protein of unknown function (DUF4019)
MKKLVLALLLAALLTPALSAPVGADENAEAEALQAANQFLSLVDAGDYAGSWDTAAALLKNAVAKEQWVKALDGARTPFGKVLSRSLAQSALKTELPGAPDGQYLVLVFAIEFAHKSAGYETVTPMLEADGRWRVAGYYLR